MKFRNWSQGFLAITVSAGIGLGLISCGQSSTIDYLYVASASTSVGVINTYLVDSQSGALNEVSGTPTNAGHNPVGLVTSPNGNNLFVINHDDNTLIAYTIGTGARLEQPTTYTLPGNAPVAVAMNPGGTLLFVVVSFAPSFSAADPGPGALLVYQVDTGSGKLTGPVTQTFGSAQSGNYYPLNTTPTGVAVHPNGKTVYVTDQVVGGTAGCPTSISTTAGVVEAFSLSSTGALTPVVGSPFCAGVSPSSIATHPVGDYLYVTDSSQNQLLGYVIESSGALLPLVGGPIPAGVQPSSVVVDPRGLYVYVANHGNNSAGLSSYSIAQGTGVPSSTGSYHTGAFPQCVIVEPALGRFVYTADFEGFGITGYQLNPNTGVLVGTQNSPYGSSGLSTCLTAAAHGNHAIINPQGTAANP